MELNIVEKMIPKKFVVTEFGEIEIYELYELLTDGLGDTSPGYYVTIYDPTAAKWLESMGAIFKGTRGGYRTEDEEKIKEIVEALREALGYNK